MLGQIIGATGPKVAIVFKHYGSHVLAENSENYLSIGYRSKLVEDQMFDLRLLKRCLQWTAVTVVADLDPFSLTAIVINRLNGVETQDWMGSHPALRWSKITNEVSMPGLLDVFAKIIAVWPLVVSVSKKFAL